MIKALYADEHKANPWKKMTKLPKTFSWRQLGSFNKSCLKAKGGQTRCLVKFCAQLMHRHNCGTKGAALAKAGDALLQLYKTMENEPRRISTKAAQTMIASIVNHVAFYQDAGGHMVYKHHGAIHMALNAQWQGNPRHVSTYEDESENGVCARIGLRAHGLTFAKSVFERIEVQNPQRRMLQDVLPSIDKSAHTNMLASACRSLHACFGLPKLSAASAMQHPKQ